VEILLLKADGMSPEGVGARRAYVRDAAAAKITNALLEDAWSAVKELWKQRGYDAMKPDEIAVRLGYQLDKYEATAWLALGATHLPLLSQPEAWSIGKRIRSALSARAAAWDQS
jgi:hypothetical protein